MNKSRTTEQNGQPDDASSTTLLHCASLMYAELKTKGHLSREDILLLYCGILVVAVGDVEGDIPRAKSKREGGRERTKAQQSGDVVPIDTSVMDCAYSMYAQLQDTTLEREDILLLLCGFFFVALTDAEREIAAAKPTRTKTRRPDTKGRSRP